MSGNSLDFQDFLDRVEAGRIVVDPDYMSYLRWLANGRPDIVVLPDDSEEEQEGSVSSICTAVADEDEEIRPERMDELRAEAKKKALEKEEEAKKKKRQRARACLEKIFFREDDDNAGPSHDVKRFRAPFQRN